MLNQIRRIWADKGNNDKDFTVEELKLKEALNTLKSAADDLSKASSSLLDMLYSSRS